MSKIYLKQSKNSNQEIKVNKFEYIKIVHQKIPLR